MLLKIIQCTGQAVPANKELFSWKCNSAEAEKPWTTFLSRMGCCKYKTTPAYTQANLTLTPLGVVLSSGNTTAYQELINPCIEG